MRNLKLRPILLLIVILTGRLVFKQMLCSTETAAGWLYFVALELYSSSSSSRSRSCTVCTPCTAPKKRGLVVPWRYARRYFHRVPLLLALSPAITSRRLFLNRVSKFEIQTSDD